MEVAGVKEDVFAPLKDPKVVPVVLLLTVLEYHWKVNVFAGSPPDPPAVSGVLAPTQTSCETGFTVMIGSATTEDTVIVPVPLH